MNKYAKIENNIVTNVIISDDSQIATFDGIYVKISESTNDAWIGGEYREDVNKFIPIKPHFDSWILDSNYVWVAPVEKPSSGEYLWDENLVQWVEYEPDNTAPEE